MRSYLAERPEATSDFVFLSYQLDGLSTTAIHKRLMRYRERSGVHLTAHRLRHSFANDLIEADVPGHHHPETAGAPLAGEHPDLCAGQ